MTTAKSEIQHKRNNMFLVEFKYLAIIPNFNVREVREDMEDIEELARDIYENGVLETLAGYANPDKKGHYLVTSGHRRYAACKLLISGKVPGIDKVGTMRLPFKPEAAKTNDRDRLVELYTRNSGKPLTSLEFANLINRLLNHGMTKQEIATRLAKSITHIDNSIKLLSLPDQVKKEISKGKLSAHQAITTLKSTSPAEAVKILTKAVEATPDGTLGDELTTKPKKVKTDTISKYSNQFNSVRIFKKLAKETAVKVLPEKEETFRFLKEVLDGNISEDDMFTYFFTDPTGFLLITNNQPKNEAIH